MTKEEIILALEEFEKIENMKYLERVKYFDDLSNTSPTVSEQLKSFFKNKKVVRRAFYNELRKRLS